MCKTTIQIIKDIQSLGVIESRQVNRFRDKFIVEDRKGLIEMAETWVKQDIAVIREVKMKLSLGLILVE